MILTCAKIQPMSNYTVVRRNSVLWSTVVLLYDIENHSGHDSRDSLGNRKQGRVNTRPSYNTVGLNINT